MPIALAFLGPHLLVLARDWSRLSKSLRARGTSGEKFVQRLAAYRLGFELMVAIDVAAQRCNAKESPPHAT
jgi:hypothetical protein